jgi:hypothetical protein
MRPPLTLAILLAAIPPAAAAIDSPASAEVCGRCHRAIHLAWKSSSHAQAMESSLFQDALDLAETDFGAAGRRVCLTCHSPIAVQTGDMGLVKKVSWEGVTCDFCHSIQTVDLAATNPKTVVRFSGVRSGPLKDAVSIAHGTSFSEVHLTSAVCAPCHEYRNGLGFPVLTTYSEWRNSSYGREGRQCQSCHMSKVAGDVVDPHVKRSSVAKVNLHLMPGSHSLDQLTSAIKAQLTTSRDGDRLTVAVEVTNQKAGHYLPTGSPLRQLVMEVRVDSYQGQQFREERVYARRVGDQAGQPISREHFAFLKSAKVLSDTRLAPGERRLEKFSFEIPRGRRAQVKATFIYYYSPLASAESQKRVTFLTLNQFVQ